MANILAIQTYRSSKNFKSLAIFVMTFGNKNQTLNHNYVTIHYIKKPSLLISKYLKFYFLLQMKLFVNKMK